MITPWALCAVYIVCVFLAEARRTPVRVAAVGLWASSVSVATLILYGGDWPGWERPLLNILWAGVLTLSLIWGIVVLRRPFPPDGSTATATLPPMSAGPDISQSMGGGWVAAEPEPRTQPERGSGRTFVSATPRPRKRIRYRVVTKRRP